MLSRLIGAKIRITLVLDPSSARLRLDPGQSGQVLTNLSVNARDARPGGGTLTVPGQGSSFRIYLPVVSDSPLSELVLVDSERSAS